MNFDHPSIVDMLRKGFAYDLWATLRWYSAVRLMKNAETASAVLQHMLSAQRTWLERCGIPANTLPRVATREAFQTMSQAFSELIASKPLSTMVDYVDRRGRPQRRELGEIAWHVINHGTFHRGHLRGLAQGEDFQEFADTDLIYFFDESRKG